ncbi:hypothetical protein C8R44DRAFT_848534 [Mycena epipterygia]|nr:hypothetical protein C8R44DRAFT_848534 [Mycena epipterygia]
MSTLPLSSFESKARIHAHIAFFAYLIPPYLHQTPYAIMNFLVTGPLVFMAFALGYQTTATSGVPHFTDPHQKAGLALLIMYLLQVFLGGFMHWLKLPFRFTGGRHPQNYLHVILGLSIVVLASWQTHYGLWIEWALATGNVHPVSWRCKHFWLAIVVLTGGKVMWGLYAIGLLLPCQFKQEAASRRAREEGDKDNLPLI